MHSTTEFRVEETRLAVLIDFENIAAGCEKEGLGRFDVDALMRRLKEKGRILVARSYADWGRFARFKQSLLTANVTMYELTSHGMQDKNRADIAMVVDALELAFTRDHLDTFVLVSGDSDFTPLVLKMRELNKRVIGCGTRNSTSRLLIQACDEFVFYDSVAKRSSRKRASPSRGKPGLGAAYDMLADALEGTQRENPDPALASVVKTAILRKFPDFSEAEYGFSSFARFLEAAEKKGHIRILRDRKSGGYRIDSSEGRPLEEDRGPSRAEKAKRAPFTDEYVPEAAMAWIGTLSDEGINPLSAPTRLTVLEQIEAVVNERRAKRRRVNVQFVTEDVKKRLRRTHPDLPIAELSGIFTALMRGGLLIHSDGTPIRRKAAPFTLTKTVSELNSALTELYLDMLSDKGADLDDASTLAELFLGDKDRSREIEEALAWLEARNAPEGEEADSGDESPAEEAQEPGSEDKKKKRRRRRKKKGDDALEDAESSTSADVLDDLLLPEPESILPDALDAILEEDDDTEETGEVPLSPEGAESAAAEPEPAPDAEPEAPAEPEEPAEDSASDDDAEDEEPSPA